MAFRTTVTLTDHFKTRIEDYAAQHGATIAGALVALAARGLDDAERSSSVTSGSQDSERTR
jgi:hypothetical protein